MFPSDTCLLFFLSFFTSVRIVISFSGICNRFVYIWTPGGSTWQLAPHHYRVGTYKSVLVGLSYQTAFWQLRKTQHNTQPKYNGEREKKFSPSANTRCRNVTTVNSVSGGYLSTSPSRQRREKNATTTRHKRQVDSSACVPRFRRELRATVLLRRLPFEYWLAADPSNPVSRSTRLPLHYLSAVFSNTFLLSHGFLIGHATLYNYAIKERMRKRKGRRIQRERTH